MWAWSVLFNVHDQIPLGHGSNGQTAEPQSQSCQDLGDVRSVDVLSVPRGRTISGTQETEAETTPGLTGRFLFTNNIRNVHRGCQGVMSG